MALDDKAHFRNMAWCKAVVEDTAFESANPRFQKHVGHDPFWFEILCKGNALRAHCLLYRKPQTNIADEVMETKELIDFSGEVTGQNGICHGGFLATLVDEAAGAFLRVYLLDNSRDPRTAFLNITYKKVVPSPGVVMITTKFLSKQGRKMRLQVTFTDSSGDTCLVAEILYITRKMESL